MSKVALVDGDMVAYRCAASCEPSKKKAAELGIPFEELQREDVQVGIQRADELLYRINNTVEASECRIFLSGSENFRKILYPEYKANRLRLTQPAHLDAIRDFMVREWGATVCAGYEADDAIGIAHDPERTIVCSNDKDFRQLEGEHYNPVTDQFEVVDTETAALAFFAQMLVGDTSDNLSGVDGLGKVKSIRILSGLTPEEMYHKVLSLYGDGDKFLLNYSLYRILRSEEEYEAILENIQRKGQGEESPEDRSTEDLTVLSGVDDE